MAVNAVSANSMTRSFTFADTLVRCRIRGDGEPVLLAHGVPGDLRTLEPVAMALSSRYRAITATLPAPRTGERPARPFGTAARVDDLTDLIEALGLGPVHLVAWSYSCHAAMALAADRPELVRSLFLYEPGFPTFLSDAGALEAVHADTMAAFGPVAAAFASGDRLAALRRAIDGAAQREGHFDTQPPALRAIHLENATMLEAVFQQTPPIPLDDAALARIRCPVTVARGAVTRACYRIVSDAAAAKIADARWVVVPEAGHLLPEERPTRFAELVGEHLAAGGAAKPDLPAV